MSCLILEIACRTLALEDRCIRSLIVWEEELLLDPFNMEV